MNRQAEEHAQQEQSEEQWQEPTEQEWILTGENNG